MRKPIILAPGEGRAYPMGRISAVFKADAPESESRYSISEWWLEPRTPGPGAHSHPEDDLFYVIDGTMSLLVGDTWTQATRGSFVLVPGGVVHDFENRGDVRAGVLNLSIPGPFEPHMPGIVEWFTRSPAHQILPRPDDVPSVENRLVEAEGAPEKADHPLDAWHRLVRSRDATGLGRLLADDVVFHSPVVHTPQRGRTLATLYLAAASDVFFSPGFRYLREIIGPSDAVLEFETEIDGIVVNGVDLIKWNDAGRIVEFKVMIRPLKAIDVVHQRMADRLRAWS